MNDSYIMISLQARRDLHDPLRFFQKLTINHLYREALWGQLGTGSESDAHTLHFSTPLDLGARLKRVGKGIVQGVEPFALLPLPFIVQILRHVNRQKLPLVVASLENIPFRQKYGPVLTAVAAPLLRRYLKRADLLIAINEGARDNFLAFGAQPEKIVRLMYGCWGVDTDEFSPTGPVAALPVCGDKPVALFVGRVVAAKGIFVLLDAFRQLHAHHPELQLVFAGDGDDAPRARELAQAYGLGANVHFLGGVPNQDIPALLRRAEMLVAPSLSTPRWAEQVGMVLLQAMACGTPVVSTVSGSIPEFVDDGRTALLVPEHDVNALAAAMASIRSDGELAARLRNNGLADIAQRYDASRNVLVAEEEILRRCAN